MTKRVALAFTSLLLTLYEVGASILIFTDKAEAPN